MMMIKISVIIFVDVYGKMILIVNSSLWSDDVCMAIITIIFVVVDGKTMVNVNCSLYVNNIAVAFSRL